MSKAETKLKRTLKTLYKQVHQYYKENAIENVNFDETGLLNYASICICDIENKPISNITLHDTKGNFRLIETTF